MITSAELVDNLLAALDGIPGLRPATLAKPWKTAWGWNWDGLAIDVTHEAGDAGDGQVVVIRVVATRLPLPPVIRQAEQALLAVLTASGLPVTRLCLEITDIDGTAFG
jgi:hypothetical protein